HSQKQESSPFHRNPSFVARTANRTGLLPEPGHQRIERPGLRDLVFEPREHGVATAAPDQETRHGQRLRPLTPDARPPGGANLHDTARPGATRIVAHPDA